MDAIQKLIGLDQGERDWLRRYYGRLSEAESIMLHGQQTQIMRSWVDARHPAADQEIGRRSVLALLSALDRHRRAAKAGGRKSRSVTSAEMDEVEQTRIAGALAAAQRPKRLPKKRQLLARRWFPAVINMRSQGMSWGGIEKFLRKHHRYSASGDYIRRAFREIVRARELRGEDMAEALAALRFQQPRAQ